MGIQHSRRRVTPRARSLAATAAGGGLILLIMLAGAARAASPAQASSPAAGPALTCFAIDVSGSNLVESDGEPPSDPGPIFVRQQVVELFDEVLADLGETAGQQVAVVTFGTSIETELGPVSLADPAARSRLETGLSAALQPSVAEAAWTDWVAGVDGCGRMFQRSAFRRGLVAVLTDGYPQGPAGGPARQLAAISAEAARLWGDGIAIQPVLYGAGAGRPGPAREAMSRLAVLGHGQLTLASTPLDMLRGSLRLASLATGLPLGGSEVPVNGSSSVPLELPSHTARAVLIVLRSSSQVSAFVSAPDGRTLSGLRAGTAALSLVVPITDPIAGSFQVSANGRGSVYAAELLRLDGVRAPAARPAHREPAPAHPTRHLRSGSTWALPAVLGALAAAAAAIAGGVVMRTRRRRRGTLVVWHGPDHRHVDPVDVDHPVDPVELFPGPHRPTGWTLRWDRRAPVLVGPDGALMPLPAGETRTVCTDPVSTFTWFPGGVDTSLTGEPPGRPAGTTATQAIPTSDRN